MQGIRRNRTWHSTLSDANTNRDGTGALQTVVHAGRNSNGLVIQYLRVVASGTTTAGVVRLYLDTGETIALVRELLVTAITPDATTESFTIEYDFKYLVEDNANYGGLVVGPGQAFRASTNNAETFQVFAMGGEY